MRAYHLVTSGLSLSMLFFLASIAWATVDFIWLECKRSQCGDVLVCENDKCLLCVRNKPCEIEIE